VLTQLQVRQQLIDEFGLRTELKEKPTMRQRINLRTSRHCGCRLNDVWHGGAPAGVGVDHAARWDHKESAESSA
jgi:hypothetical protein